MGRIGEVAALDFVEHLIDIRCREGVASRGAHDFQFLARYHAWLGASRRSQCEAHPLGRRHLLPARRLLDFRQFLLW